PQLGGRAAPSCDLCCFQEPKGRGLPAGLRRKRRSSQLSPEILSAPCGTAPPRRGVRNRARAAGSDDRGSSEFLRWRVISRKRHRTASLPAHGQGPVAALPAEYLRSARPYPPASACPHGGRRIKCDRTESRCGTAATEPL